MLLQFFYRPDAYCTIIIGLCLKNSKTEPYPEYVAELDPGFSVISQVFEHFVIANIEFSDTPSSDSI